MTRITEIIDLLYKQGQIMSGSEMSNEDAMAYGRTHAHISDGYCLVRNWIWVDLIVDERQRAELSKSGLTPALVYAHTVIFDSNRRWDVGDFVRTSPLQIFEEGFLFKTLNTTYLLLGEGRKAEASPQTVACII